MAHIHTTAPIPVSSQSRENSNQRRIPNSRRACLRACVRTHIASRAFDYKFESSFVLSINARRFDIFRPRPRLRHYSSGMRIVRASVGALRRKFDRAYSYSLPLSSALANGDGADFTDSARARNYVEMTRFKARKYIAVLNPSAVHYRHFACSPDNAPHADLSRAAFAW